MELRQALLRLLDYEEWALGACRKQLHRFPEPEIAVERFRHILGCYSYWATKVSDWIEVPDDQVDIETDLEKLLTLWRGIIEDGSLGEEVLLGERDGKDRVVALWELCHHVINHSSYHRGEINALAKSVDFKRYPDTDSIFFFVRNRDKVES